jgi:hypothetical protein
LVLKLRNLLFNFLSFPKNGLKLAPIMPIDHPMIKGSISTLFWVKLHFGPNSQRVFYPLQRWANFRNNAFFHLLEHGWTHMQLPPGRSKQGTRIDKLATFNLSPSGITLDLRLTVSCVLNGPRWTLPRG